MVIKPMKKSKPKKKKVKFDPTKGLTHKQILKKMNEFNKRFGITKHEV
jgi:hypothetical protein